MKKILILITLLTSGLFLTYNASGASVAESRFFVYTTGVANWGSTGDDDLVSSWLEGGICNNILKQIPPQFTSVSIIHFDPILSFDGSLSEDQKEVINSSAKERLNYSRDEEGRLVSSEFRREKFDYRAHIDESLANYIIVDLAHIFILSPEPNCVRLNYSSYEEGVDEETDLALSVIRFGFPSLKSPSFHIGASMKLFEVNAEDGRIKTYRDCLKEKGLIDFSVRHKESSQYIDDIFTNIRHSLEDKICEIKGARYWQITHISGQIIKEEYLAIMQQIFDDYIWGEGDHDADALRQAIMEGVIERNLDQITSMDLIES